MPSIDVPLGEGRPPQTRRRLGIFFAVWSAAAGLAVYWLWHRSGNVGFGWSSDATGHVAVWERIVNWFRLADLNFHGVYPWILAAPYILWLGTRFRFERGHWGMAALAHLGGCALFVLAADAVTTRSAGNIREVIVTSHNSEVRSADGKRFVQTNEVRFFTNRAGGRLPVFAAGWPAPPPEMAAAARLVGSASGGGGRAGSLFWKREEWDSLPQLLNILGYASLVGLAHAVHFYGRFRERERRAAVLETQLAKARLSALQAQLHPHFLFNALNAISTLMQRDTKAAQEGLASFSELLRLALSQTNQPETPLRQDLEFLRRYVEIQQTRLGDRLRFEEEVEPEILDCLAPALLLQPLVENAIRHGIEPSPTPGWVRVTGKVEAGRVVLIVEDNGAGPGAAREQRNGGAGVGLENLRARLESLYGDAQKVEFGARAQGGARVRVEIPLRRMEASK